MAPSALALSVCHATGGRAAWNIASVGLADTSFSVGFRFPDEPAVNRRPVSLVADAKLARQRWLFVDHHKQMHGEQERKSKHDDRRRRKGQTSSQYYGTRTHVHWVAHVTVRAPGHELARRIKGSRSASAFGDKRCDTNAREKRARGSQHQANRAEPNRQPHRKPGVEWPDRNRKPRPQPHEGSGVDYTPQDDEALG